MALPPQKLGVQFVVPGSFAQGDDLTVAGTSIPSVVEIELFHDFTCPFSAKMFLTLYDVWATLQMEKGKGSAIFIFHPIVQPWHPQSTLVHEAALAVKKITSTNVYFQYCKLLFQEQKRFFDIDTWSKSREQIYEELVNLAGECGIDKDAMQQLLSKNRKLQDQGFLNVGTYVTDDLKLAVKFQRKKGVHVSPTVFVNGIEATQVSSSWTSSDWMNFLKDYNILSSSR